MIVLDHLSEPQRRALVIADNKIAESAGWDEAMLRAKLCAARRGPGRVLFWSVAGPAKSKRVTKQYLLTRTPMTMPV